ncbi:NACHT and WD40 repeat domain-containing protein [Mycoavidus cysteinexigens]|uniref:NACHT and WD40 repeat domain-containing protein n=1 Tax=Mycoavidus cysteinexigens TaxID=1553431 RepID=UPI00137562A2|nr:NACHT domain-containing protein [Mycoavidus cysteinexigens]GAM52477.1 hypothetical protein EBME_0940 [bacterium endosymbiont of Mortierella elongata FMR23-6]
MLPINQSKSTQPSLTSSFSQSTSAFSNTVARPDSTDRIYEPAESVTQVSTGLVSIPVSGSNHQVEVHYHGTPLDLRLLETLIQQQNLVLQPNTTSLATLGEGIKTMRKTYLSGLHDDETIRDALSLYVAPEGKAVNSGESGERFDLNSKFNTFLESDKKVFLLLGEAGSGKSTFNRYLARDLWEKYEQANEKKDERIPVFIQLTTLEDPNKNLLTEFFSEEGFSKEQIQQLRQSRRFIFILDGYDEIKHRQRAFYTDNKLDKWDAKVIISSRPEYLGASYQSKFYPSGQARVFEECELAPFSESAIEDYVERHIRHAQDPKWNADQYQSALAHPDLQALIGNPFLLKIVLQVLPSLGSEEGSSNQRSYTRIALYEQFAKNWFDRSQNRLQGIQLTKEEQKTFNRLAEEDFIQHGIHFSQEFALALYEKQVLVATYLPSAPDQAQEWRNFLGNDDEKKRLLRFNAPLSRQEDQYRFIHKSLRDYFVARALWEELAAGGKIEAFSRFNRLNIVNDPAILQFLAEGVRQESQLETRLLSVVEQSKGEEGAQFEKAAANALTLLVKSNVQLINKDFSGIRVPEADLSYGLFDHTQFKGADLRKVNWRGAWLRGVNLNGADLKGVELGERPTLEMGGKVDACCYSPDGDWFAVAGDSGVIQLYETVSMQRVHTYEGHKEKVTSVAFSKNSHWLASGSYDSTVKLWSMNVLGSRRLAYTYKGHEKEVASVAFSPNGDWLASGSWDRTVKLWGVLDPHGLAHIYKGHEKEVTSVAFSPDGLWIASGSSDCTVKLWHALYVDEPAYTYVGHKDEVASVAFSPKGDWLASGSYDNTAKLWSTSGTRELAHTYAGHDFLVMSVAFSPDGHWLVTGSMDFTVKLWDVLGVRRLVHTYAGHEETVNSVAFSPGGQWVASGGDDWTVKLWSVLSTHEFRHITDAGHKGAVNSIAFSRDGDWLASGSDDKTLKLWSVLGAGGLRHVATAWHDCVVNSLAFSPNGDWLASASDDEAVLLLGLTSSAQELTDTYVEHEENVTSVAFSPNGDLLASGGWDNTVKLWSFMSGTWSFVCAFKHDNWVRGIAFSPHGDWLASGSDDKTVKLWCVLSRKLEHTYSGHESLVMSVAFSPNGLWIASGGDDKSVRLWGGLSPRELLHTYSGHWQGVKSIAFSPDSDWLASGSNDNTVRIWSVQKGDCQAIIRGFIGPVYSVKWKIMPDGNFMLATAGLDTTIRFWRILRDSLGEIDQVLLEWASEQRTLVASDALIGAARNLSSENEALLIERGAIDFFEEDSDKSSSELGELGEVSLESDGDDFTESDTNRYSWPEGELVEEGAPDTESSAKKRVHSTSSIPSGINRKKGKGDDSFL